MANSVKNPRVGVSSAYKGKVFHAVLALGLFFLAFILLLASAILFAGIFSYLGLALIVSYPAFFTLAVGLGMVLMGFLVLIFVIKFLFTQKKYDRSHLLEISREDQPQVFELIDDIVRQTGTAAPKKTYLSADVNASVFYDSSFWSMFLPVKKNLVIGMGLIHSATVDELKAVLSHEFGHFSQRAMKLGSYVYSANRVIYNMLYENERYVQLGMKIANLHSYFSFFVNLAFKVVIGIQWVLRKVYAIVTLKHLALSREMEFHADQVAASVAGYRTCSDALLRIELADLCYNKTINYYNLKISEGVKTENIYNNFVYVLKSVSNDSGLSTIHGFPKVTRENYIRFQETRIVIKDQWASHPDMPDRIEALEKTSIEVPFNNVDPAVSIFNSREQLETQLTSMLFSGVSYEQDTRSISAEEFSQEYDELFRVKPFPELFNHYYDNKDPVLQKDKDGGSTHLTETVGELTDATEYFRQDRVEWIYESHILESDITTLKRISCLEIDVKSFDYNGEKFTQVDASGLIPLLQKELEEIQRKIRVNDELIFRHFTSQARKLGKEEAYFGLFINLEGIDKQNAIFIQTFMEMQQAAAFISVETPFDEIEANMITMKERETAFREQMKVLLQLPEYRQAICEERRNCFEDYLNKDLTYFRRPDYDNDALACYYQAMEYFHSVITETRLECKRSILETMEQLANSPVRMALHA